MGNHYHLVVETIDPTLAKGMRQLNGVYTQRFNRRHHRTGHLLQGRYKAILVEKESHALEVCRYVVLNPVRAKLVKEPEGWKWSSYRGTAGLKEPHGCLSTDWLLRQFHVQRTVRSTVFAWDATFPWMVVMNAISPHLFGWMRTNTIRFIRGNGSSQYGTGIIMIMLCVASSALFQACRESRESLYPSLADAVKSGEVSRGWLPGFLPSSSRAIHLVYNPSSPRTWCAFEFSPDDSQHFRENLRSADTLPPGVRRIGTPGVSWWPDFLKGDVDVGTLRNHGFVPYIVVEPDIGSSTQVVFFAIDWEKGRGSLLSKII